MGLLSSIVKVASKIPIVKSVIAKAPAALNKVADIPKYPGATTSGGWETTKQTVAKVASSLSSTYTKALTSSPVKTIAATAAAPIVATAVVSNPKTVSSSVKAGVDLYATALKVAANPSSAVDKAKEYVKEHPVATSVFLGAAAAYGISKVPSAAGYVVGKLSDQQSLKDQYNQLVKEQQKYKDEFKNPTPLPTDNSKQPSPSVGTPGVMPVSTSSDIPLTPATQVLGKSVSTGTRKKKKKRINNGSMPQIRLNVINANQSRLSTSRTYLSRNY